MYICCISQFRLGFPDGSVVKNLPAMQKMQVQSLGQEDPLKKEMVNHSGILAWKIPWMRSLGVSTVHRVANSQTWLSAYTRKWSLQTSTLQMLDSHMWLKASILGSTALESCFSNYDVRISLIGSIWKNMRGKISGSTLDLLNKNLHFSQICR